MAMTDEERKIMNRVWSKNYRARHPDRRKESAKKYRESNRELLRKQGRERYEKQKERLGEINKKYSKTAKAKEKAKARYLKNRAKIRARNIIGKRIQRGVLVPKPCEKCNFKITEAHHPDYSKPLKIVWLCKQCHCLLHRK